MTAALRVDDPVLLSFADEVGDSEPIAVEGARTRWTLGGELTAGTRIVTAPSGIVSYQPEEMTIQVRAGTTVAELHAELSARGQRTPLPERGGTVGGAIVVGENAIGTMARGFLRASVLQVRYVSDGGRVVTGGGPTVKNVSGFDLPRLITGSLGTLGLLAEVTLRTNPIPATSVWLRSEEADAFSVRATTATASSVLTDGATTWIHLEGHAPDLAADRRRLADTTADLVEIDGPPQLPPHRWSLPPAALRNLHEVVPGPWIAEVGVGLVFADAPQPERALDAGAAVVANRLKEVFDPSGRLNPGRVPGAR